MTIIAQQSFNALGLGPASTDGFPAGSTRQPLTAAAATNAGGDGLDFATLWSDTRGTGGPLTPTSDTSDFIGVNAFTGTGAPNVSPDGVAVAAGTEQNFQFNDGDGLLELVFEPVALGGFAERTLSLDYWIAPTSFEGDDAFAVTLSDGASAVTVLALDEAGLDAATSADDGTANWRTLTVDLEALGLDLDAPITLTVAVDADAAAENVFIDDVAFEGEAVAVGDVFTLQILHASDLEGGVDAIERAPNFAAIVDALEQDAADEGWASILLSAGDNYLPGPFAGAAADPALRPVLDAVYEALLGQTYDVRENIARVDLTIMNVLGFDASAIGNHEFDFGANEFLTLVNDDVRGSTAATRWLGTFFPYLSANLEFSGQSGFEDGVDPVVTDAILPNDAFAPNPADAASIDAAPKIAQATTIARDGELIGVVGATTQRVTTISSTNGVVETTSNGTDDMVALAAALQPVIDDLIDGADDVAGNGDDVNKVILVSHLQDINLEKQLAGLLRGVDVIVAGGSDTRLADETDRLREGDAADGDYPFETTDADGNPLLIVSTDGEYSYVGRLVVEFDANGRLVNFGGGDELVDAAVSGAFVTDEQGVTDVTGADSAQEAVDASFRADLVEQLVDAVSNVVTAQDANVFGRSDVFIEGRREFVRTEQTTLGDLSADANLAYAKSVVEAESEDGAPVETVVVSIKNGGGIRAAIGEVDGVTGDLLPTSANPASGKEAGEISQLDIVNALRFNNGLTLLTLTTAQLAQVLEHAVAATGPGLTPGQFPQVSGMRFSFDPDQPAGDRIQNAGIFAEDGTLIAEIVRDGAVVDNGDATFRIVTLNFLAGGGDGYPFPAFAATSNRVDLVDPTGPRTGVATFAADGSEQDAFAEFLAANFAETPFSAVETGPEDDDRIQNLNFRADAVFEPELPPTPVATGALGPIAVAQVLDSGAGEGGSEVVAFDGGRLYVTNGALGAIDVWDAATGELVGRVDLTFLPGFESVQSVAARGGLIAAAVATPDIVNGDVQGRNGYVALIDAGTLQVIDRVTVGNLPDGLAFTADGTKIVVANEGEFNAERGLDVDPAGSISIIDVSDLIDPQVVTVGFDGLDVSGLRLAPTATPLNSIEPEYVAISADGSRAFVTLQEANGVAVVDLATNAIVDLIPLGTVDHGAFGFELDPADDGAIGIGRFPGLVGLRMPDAIATYVVDGATFFVTANEGDGRGDGDEPFGDEARVGNILDGEIPGLSIDASVDTEGLERLVVSTVDGDTDGDGDIDVLHAFGSRGFTIFAEDGTVVFDSGSQFELILADIAAERFNNDDGETIGAGEDDAVDNRSDAKGPEPEALAIGEIDGRSYAFIGLERDSGVMIYDVTDPAAPVFVDYIDGFANGGVGPETIVFIPADQSATGVAQIAVAYEITGNTIVYDLGLRPVEGPLLNETFDYAELGEAPRFTLTDENGGAISFFAEATSFDYFGVFDGDGDGGADFGADPAPTSFNAYGGFADNYLAASDIDGGDPAIADPAFLVWSGFDITGYEAVNLTASLATNDGDAGLDPSDFVAFEVRVDGGAWMRVLAFETADATTSNQPTFLRDTDFDGIGDGDALTSAFQAFSTDFAVSGSTLDLRLAIRVEAGFEDVAVDDIVLQRGEIVDEPADFDLQITEMWPGQNGTDVTADWFEITNFGTEAWTAAEGALFYDDDSMDPAVADAIQGIETIAAGESVIVVIGQQADADVFRDVWGAVTDLTSVQVGFTDGAGLGQGGDAVTLFVDADGALGAEDVADVEAFPDANAASGRSWDVPNAQFSSVAALDGVVETAALGGETGTEPAVGSPGALATPAVAPTLISAIQGSGAQSPLAGQTVTVRAVVTVTAAALDGFFLQEEDADADADPLTSEGLFVFLGADPTVAVGDVVTVTGTVAERFGVTTLTNVAVEVEQTGAPLPSAVSFTLPLPDATDPAAFYESVEGMRVRVTAGDGERLTVTDAFTDFGEVGITSGAPLVQPTQLFESFTPEQQALTEANRRDYLLVEDAEADALSSAPRVGDGIVGDAVEGVMHFSFGDYKIETQGPVEFDASVNPNPRQDAPADVGGTLKVASFNVLNYFTTLGSRGAATPEELADQTAKIVAALAAIDADVVGLIEIENDLGGVADEATAALVDALNAVVGAGTYAFVPTGRIGTDEIKQAFLYKPATVSLAGDFAVLEDESFTAPFTPGNPQSRPALAQTFVETATGESVTVTVNHFKSKGSTTGAVVNGEADDNPVEGSAALTRVAAAQALAAWLETDPTGSGDADHLVIGDLNAYAMERAIKALEAEGYTNLNGPEAVSFYFDGRGGTLDYAFANEPLLAQVTGATVWNVNSPEAYSIQYDGRDFDAFGDLSAFASSDHDAVVVGLDLDSEPELILVEGTRRNDTLRGTDADELFRGLGGTRDVITTGLGEDTIEFGAWVVQGKRGQTVVTDFDPFLDDISLVDGAEIIGLREGPAGVRLTFNNGSTVMLRGVEADQLDFLPNDDTLLA